MLESLVASKIRRTLLEYILTHLDHRFYLRGVAKELVLPVSPVQRELKRLERLGLLKTQQEANIRFYLVDQACPHFVQLKQAFMSSTPTVIPAGASTRVGEAGIVSTRVSHAKIERIRKALGPTIPWPVMLRATSLVVVVMVAVGVGWYLTMMNQRLRSVTSQLELAIDGSSTLTSPTLTPPIVVVESATPQASRPPVAPAVVAQAGEMRSTRFRLSTEAMGGVGDDGG